MTLARRCGAHGATREAAVRALLQRLRDEGIEQVRIAWADLHGSFRAKTLVGIDAVAAACDDGIGMVGTLLLKDMADRTAFKVFEPGALDGLPGFGAAGNVLLLPDPASLQILPWAPATAWLRAEPTFADGTPVQADPRRVLQRALAALADAGWSLQCGLEVEFHVYRIADDHLAADQPQHSDWPAEPPALRLLHPGYQLLSEAWADLADDALAIVRRTCHALGLPLQSLEIELGPSQFEAVFAPTDALTAADQMLLFRNHVRQALRRAGYHASFVCLPPLPNAVASGWHLHHSLLDRSGANAFADEEQPLSDVGRHWLAGLLAHAPGMAALCAPTIPAYSRFRGSVMAPQAAVWGRDNRGAMLRVIGDRPGVASAATRIENRLGEPLANPYLLIAAQVIAGLDGMQRRLQPGPPTEAPYAAGLPPLPTSLAAALDALAADDVLQQGLGHAMSLVLQTVKRQELARHEQAPDKAAWERREYFSRF